MRMKYFPHLLILFLSTQSLSAWADELDALNANNRGVHLLEEKKGELAERYFLDAMSLDPKRIEPKMNLGLCYEAMKKPDRAYKEYNGVLRRTDITNEARFMAHFNAAGAAAANKNIDLALSHYQEALNLDPESHEVKANIELLFKNGSGQGQGEKKDDKQGQGQGENQNPQQPNQGQKDQPQEPKPEKQKFKSEKLSEDDVKKIMEELKAQEQKIRALDYSGQKSREVPGGKDW